MLKNHGTLGRKAQVTAGMETVADFKPSAAAVSLISPAAFVDCTMTCARPLNKLRDH